LPKERFEDALDKLEKIVSRLEEGDISLEESLKLFEDGIKLSRFCSQKLEEAERKVEILLRDKEGNRKTEPFEPLINASRVSNESSKQDPSEEAEDPSKDG
jgi:exodeoxyribonuclease VII small subunit